MADIQLGNELVKIPDYALDSTSLAMVEQLKKIAKDNESLNTAFQKLINSTNEAAKTGKQNQAELVDTLRDAVAERKKDSKGGRADTIEANFQKFGEALGWTIGKLTTFGAVVTGIGVAIAGTVYSAYSDLSDNILELQKVGVGFNDVNGSVMTVITSMNQLGVGTDQAVKLMTEFSRTTAIVGRDRLPKLTKQFLEMTNRGRDLGLNLEQASEAMMEEVEARSRLMNISGIEESKLAQSARNQLQLQSAYATALGISTDRLRETTSSLLEGNHNVAAALTLFPKSYDALNSFVTASAATMGKEGEAVISAMIDAGTGIGAFSTDSAVALAGLNGIVPGMGEMMQRFQNSMAGGFTSVEDGVALSKELTDKIANANTRELQLAARMNNATGEMARNMLMAQRNVIAAQQKSAQIAKNMKSLDADNIRDGVMTFENAMAVIFGQFESFKNILMVKFAPFLKTVANVLASDGVLDAVAGAFETISAATSGLISSLFGFEKGAGQTAESLGKRLPEIIKTVGDTITRWITEFTAWSAKFKDEAGNMQWGKLLGGAIISAMKDTAIFLAKALWSAISSPTGWLIVGGIIAALIAKSIIGGILSAVGTGIAGKIFGTGGVAGGAGGAAGAAGGAGGFASSLAGAAGSAMQILALGAAVMMFAKAMQMIDGLKNGVNSFALVASGLAAIGLVAYGLGAGSAVSGLGVAMILALGAAVLALGYSLKLATPMMEAIGGVLTVLGDNIEKQGVVIVGVVDAISTGIAKVVGAVSEGLLKLTRGTMMAGVDAIKQLSSIPNSNINLTAAAIYRLSGAMTMFAGSAGGIGAVWDNAVIGTRILALNLFADLDATGINRSASAISKLTNALGSFAGLDSSGIKAVSGAVDVMTASNERATSAYDRFGELDSASINKNSLAVFNMNAANRGQVIAPTPMQGGNYLRNQAKASTGTADVATADKNKGATGSSSVPLLPKGDNKVEELLYKVVHNTYLSANHLRDIKKEKS